MPTDPREKPVAGKQDPRDGSRTGVRVRVGGKSLQGGEGWLGALKDSLAPAAGPGFTPSRPASDCTGELPDWSLQKGALDENRLIKTALC